MESKIKRT